MVKQMKKSKLKGQVTVMESAQSPLGVRTRAKTLALQRLHNANSLRRSPRLENKRLRDYTSNPNPNSTPNSRFGLAKDGAFEEESGLHSFQASFGENALGIQGAERSTRETTPCSLIRGSATVGTPGSTTRRSSSSATNRRTQNTSRRTTPLVREIDEFFAGAEEQQRRMFIEKYNFDPINESPLPGRYEWEKVNP